MSGLLNAIDISSKGLSVQRTKMNVVAENIANAETTKTEKGGPYRRQQVAVSENKVSTSFNSHLKKAGLKLSNTSSGHMSSRGLTIKGNAEMSDVNMKIIEDGADNFKLVHDPSHPDADADGYVKYPDIEVVTEMVDMMAASRAYEANTVAISTAKKMAEQALDI